MTRPPNPTISFPPEHATDAIEAKADVDAAEEAAVRGPIQVRPAPPPAMPCLRPHLSLTKHGLHGRCHHAPSQTRVLRTVRGPITQPPMFAHVDLPQPSRSRSATMRVCARAPARSRTASSPRTRLCPDSTVAL
jgi:hypothetical protein